MANEHSRLDETADSAITRARARADKERRQTESDLAAGRAESDEVLTRDEVVTLVSHDLRSMLSSIMGMASLIEEDAGPSGGEGGIAARARGIVRGTVRMNRLIGDLTDAANIAAGTLTVTPAMADLAAIASEALEMFHPRAIERRVALEAAIESPLRPAFFDSARIYQVVTNLLGNAIKFTPAGGTVKMKVYSTADELCVAVSDTGIGIAPEQITAVFARNVQLAKNDRRGAGLGLYISRFIVGRHGGRIWAESRPGGGSTFSFTIPSPRQGNQI